MQQQAGLGVRLASGQFRSAAAAAGMVTAALGDIQVGDAAAGEQQQQHGVQLTWWKHNMFFSSTTVSSMRL
jgi:hypothetical protein